MLLDLYSPNGSYDNIFLANYATINLQYALTRMPGVSQVQIFGAGPYAMRIWVNPDTLANLGVTVPDIINAVQSAEQGKSCRPDRRRARSSRPAVHLQRARPGTPAHGGRSSNRSWSAPIPTAPFCA